MKEKEKGLGGEAEKKGIRRSVERKYEKLLLVALCAEETCLAEKSADAGGGFFPRRKGIEPTIRKMVAKVRCAVEGPIKRGRRRGTVAGPHRPCPSEGPGHKRMTKDNGETQSPQPQV